MKITQLFNYSLILIFVGFTSIGCLSNDDNSNSYNTTGYFPALDLTYSLDSVQPVNKPTKFYVTFKLEGSCQQFIELRKLNTSNAIRSDIGVFGSQRNSADCTNDPQFVTKSFTMTPSQSGEHTIRVWSGKDLSGEDMFISKVVNIPAQ